MGLEINVIGFIPLAMISIHNKKSAMSYFIAQSIGSLLLLYGGLTSGVVAFACVVGAVLKLGIAPLHFWVPPVVRRLPRAAAGALMSWQKVAPLFLLLASGTSAPLLSVANVVVGAGLALVSASLLPLIVFSGLTQMAWVLALGPGGCMIHYLALYYISLAAVL